MLEVTVYLRGGATLTFQCDEIRLNKHFSGEITGYCVDGLHDEASPMYIKPDEIIAVMTKQYDEGGIPDVGQST